MQNFIWGLVIAFSAISCSKNTNDKKSEEPLAAASFLDVNYGSDTAQQLDIYLPENRTSATTRTIVIIHGGGWTAGDKDDFKLFVEEFQKRLPTYAIVNLNYRLATSSGNYFPTQENDVQSAMTFLKNKSSDYSVSREFILLGISAGAHLAMLQAYKHADVIKPVGIVSFFGPVDLERLYVNADPSIPWVLKQITNTTPEERPDIFQQSSPINYVSTGAPPTLLLHGDKDEFVPLEQAEMLKQKLDALNVANSLVVYPGEGHGWLGEPLNDSFNKVETFVRGLANQ